jgi:A/G-specific adenine glycosylase
VSPTPSRPTNATTRGLLRARAGLPAEARAAILKWYEANGRRLPFRAITDPYAVLVSEVMAQQTQISRAAEGRAAFVARFPTIGALAVAQPSDVLRAWRGLGYNRRALNLWRAARVVVEEHGGQLPSNIAQLERLPGVGPYTARAVAATAFGTPVAAVDTNVRRVIGRSLGGSRDAFGARELQSVADASVPADRSAEWTHALMDLGAGICRPAPRCSRCPIRSMCLYAAGGGADERPRATPAAKAAPFPQTSRWLRGRILDRLRDARSWVELDEVIGGHDRTAIEKALRAMEVDGLVERHPGAPLRARLPIASAATAG